MLFLLCLLLAETDAQKYAKAVEAQRAAQIAEYEAGIADANAKIALAGNNRRIVAQQRSRIANLTDSVQRLRADRAYQPRLSAPLKVEAIGHTRKARTVEIIDDNSAVVELEFGTNVEKFETVFLQDFPTKGIADDQEIQIKEPLEVIGTKKHGLKTYMLLRKMNLDDKKINAKD